jgi:hypothetical protein
MENLTATSLATAALTAGIVAFGVAPASAGLVCPTGNMCSYDSNSYEGTLWTGGSGDFVEVVDDRTNSARNFTSKNYNAKNNTALAQEQTIAYIGAGVSISSFSGWNNTIDHYRKA